MPKGYRLNHVRLRKAREKAGFSSTEAAARVGVSERQLQRFETGKQEPKLSRLVLMLDAYGVPHAKVVYFLAPVPSVVRAAQGGAA